MTSPYQSAHWLATVRIVAIYALFGLAWIYGSDTALGWLVHDPAVMVHVALFKGSLFIICTATLLYFLISRFARQLAAAENRRVESLRNYETIFNATNEAIIVHDAASGGILDVNERMLEIYGYSRDNALTVDIGELSEGSPPYSPADAAAYLRMAMEEGPQVFEWHARRRNGELFWSEVSLRLITTDGSDRIIAVIRDIDERKQAERALAETSSKIMTLVESVPGYIAFVNIESFKYEYVNSAFAQFFGLPREKVIGSHVQEIIGKDNYQSALKYVEEVKAGKPVSYEKSFELVSGKRWIQVNYLPIAGANGEVSSMIVHCFDITNLKEHEQEQLKIEKLESLGILAGGIAHDFNNILSGIMGNISLARLYIDEGSKAYKPLSGAEKASVRATELARQLLTFARGGEPVKKVVSLKNLVSESLSLVLRGSKVMGIVDIPDSIHAIEADEGQMGQVCNNIIINALQAMPDGGTLTVAAQNLVLNDNNPLSLPAGHYVGLTFTDEGGGIAENELIKIFDPYYTTKAQGSGLGLASAHSIVLRHGGRIGASSVVGKGTTLTIHLPSIGEPYTKDEMESAKLAIKSGKGRAILVMDDEELIRELASAMLAEMGYRVTTCSNGLEAITHYKAAMDAGGPFVAVIMDLTIPGGMGGKEAAQKILAMDSAAKLIVSSGYSEDPIMAEYSAFGFVGAVAKPYRLNDLCLLLNSLLANSPPA